MIVFPAIDLYDGEVVRLRQGKLTEKTVYPGTAVSFAQRWVADGAMLLHVVDLNAAFEGEQRNLHIIKQIVAAARACEGIAQYGRPTSAQEALALCRELTPVGGEEIIHGPSRLGRVSS